MSHVRLRCKRHVATRSPTADRSAWVPLCSSFVETVKSIWSAHSSRSDGLRERSSTFTEIGNLGALWAMYSARPMVANDLARSMSVYTSRTPRFRETRMCACACACACFHEERNAGDWDIGARVDKRAEQRRVFFYQRRGCYPVVVEMPRMPPSEQGFLAPFWFRIDRGNSDQLLGLWVYIYVELNRYGWCDSISLEINFCYEWKWNFEGWSKSN